MKLYVISGLGADGSIFEYIQFLKKFTEIIYIDWLIPNYNESFENYVNRMAEKSRCQRKILLLGYSFGGIMVQEIHKLKPAEK